MWPLVEQIFPDHPQYWNWISLLVFIGLGFLGENLERQKHHEIAMGQLKEFGPDLVKDLANLLEGKMSADEFERKLEALPREMGQVLCDLSHYLSDADIRQKDPTYAEMQNNELRKLIELIRSGGSPKEIERINFLAPS
jgi:hypothetical protein